MASRLATLLPVLIHPAQAGFVNGRSATANIRKVLAVLERTSRSVDEAAVIVVLDAEKAFDHLNIQWLFETMKHMGFRG